MTAVDYEREALRALGLCHSADADAAHFHHVGETKIADSPDACRAIVARRLDRVRRVLRDAHLFTPEQRARVEAMNFLSWGEYNAALARVVSIRERLQKIDNAERRKEFDRQHRDNVYFYADHTSPQPHESHLARIFDPDRFTRDWAGYVAYLETVAPSLCGFFYRRLPVLIPEDARKRHSYITGQSGSGKSELLKVLFSAYLRTKAPVTP